MSDTPRTTALSKTAKDIYALDVDSAALWAADYAALCGTLERQNAELLEALREVTRQYELLRASDGLHIETASQVAAREAIRRAEG